MKPNGGGKNGDDKGEGGGAFSPELDWLEDLLGKIGKWVALRIFVYMCDMVIAMSVFAQLVWLC